MKSLSSYTSIKLFSFFGIFYFIFILFKISFFILIIVQSNQGDYELFDAMYGFIIDNLKYFYIFLISSFVLNVFIFIEILLNHTKFKFEIKSPNNKIYKIILNLGFIFGYLPIFFWILNSILNLIFYLLS